MRIEYCHQSRLIPKYENNEQLKAADYMYLCK